MHRRLSLAVLLLSASLCGMGGEESEAKEGHQRVAEALRARSLGSLPEMKKTSAIERRSVSLPAILVPVHACMRATTSSQHSNSSSRCATSDQIYAAQFPGALFSLGQDKN